MTAEQEQAILELRYSVPFIVFGARLREHMEAAAKNQRYILQNFPEEIVAEALARSAVLDTEEIGDCLHVPTSPGETEG